MARTWTSPAAAISDGKTAGIGRVAAGLPAMLKYASALNTYRGDIPLAWLIVKGAWESKGVASTRSASGNDIGLFQIKLNCAAGDTAQGFTCAQLLDPANNIKAFTNIIKSSSASFLRTHGLWFPERTASWQFWGVMWLAAAIGPGATRHLLDAVGPGQNSFDRVLAFVEKNPAWLVASSQTSFWGSQSGSLIGFRTMLAKRIIDEAKRLESSGMAVAGAAGGAGSFFLVGGIIVGAYYLTKYIRRRRAAATSTAGLGKVDWKKAKARAKRAAGAVIAKKRRELKLGFDIWGGKRSLTDPETYKEILATEIAPEWYVAGKELWRKDEPEAAAAEAGEME